MVVVIKNKHNNSVLLIKTKNELERKYNLKIDKYNYQLDGAGGVILIPKTLEQLEDEYLDNRESLKQQLLAGTELNAALTKLKKIYDAYQEELINSPFYDAQKIVANNQEHEVNETTDEMNQSSIRNV